MHDRKTKPTLEQIQILFTFEVPDLARAVRMETGTVYQALLQRTIHQSATKDRYHRFIRFHLSRAPLQHLTQRGESGPPYPRRHCAQASPRALRTRRAHPPAAKPQEQRLLAAQLPTLLLLEHLASWFASHWEHATDGKAQLPTHLQALKASYCGAPIKQHNQPGQSLEEAHRPLQEKDVTAPPQFLLARKRGQSMTISSI